VILAAGEAMRRREFIAFVGSTAAAWARTARAQQQPMPVIGFLNSSSPTSIKPFVAAFGQGLSESSYVEGQNLMIEYRWADGHSDRLLGLAADLVKDHVAVMVAAGGTEPARAVMAATTVIPIVFVSAADPVQMGLVTSLNRPGGNVTGVSLIGSALEAKRLEILHEFLPSVLSVAVLIDPSYPAAKIQAQEVHEAAERLGLKVIIVELSPNRGVESGFMDAIRQGAGAFLVTQNPLSNVISNRIMLVADKQSMPGIYWQKEFTRANGLISYGPDFSDGYRQAGVYVGRILKGEKPADLPIMQPTKFELAINLKTAKKLNLNVPPTLLARADEVIE
jgi:putative tryptophan/tyrosine transport system substrate-binding protein